MTIQWTVIATFLYLELLFIFLLLLPFITPKIWQYIFQSRIFRVIAAKANMYFTIFIIVLILFFLDSVREMLKYSHKSTKDYEAELQLNMKLFRSQRNYYISGFTVFLWLVIRRLIVLILEEAELLDENETAMKRAQSATETFQKLQRKEENEVRPNHSLNVQSDEEIEFLNKELKEKKCKLSSAEKDIEDIKSRIELTTKEYKTMLLEYNKLNTDIESEHSSL